MFWHFGNKLPSFRRKQKAQSMYGKSLPRWRQRKKPKATTPTNPFGLVHSFTCDQEREGWFAYLRVALTSRITVWSSREVNDNNIPKNGKFKMKTVPKVVISDEVNTGQSDNKRLISLTNLAIISVYEHQERSTDNLEHPQPPPAKSLHWLSIISFTLPIYKYKAIWTPLGR